MEKFIREVPGEPEVEIDVEGALKHAEEEKIREKILQEGNERKDAVLEGKLEPEEIEIEEAA